MGVEDTLDEARIALLGAALGGVASLAGVFATNFVTSRLESRRQYWSRQQSYVERLRHQVADLLRLMFRVEYLIYSLCWVAMHLPERLDASRTQSYEQDMELLMPELSGALVVLSGLDEELYAVFNRWVDQLGIFDGEVRLLIYQERTGEVFTRLSAMVDPLRDFYHTLPTEIGPLLSQREHRELNTK
jgi:hypothetical protein